VDKWHAYIFSQSVACRLILLTRSFTEQNIFKFFLGEVQFISNFSCMSHTFGVKTKNFLPGPRSPRFSLTFLSKKSRGKAVWIGCQEGRNHWYSGKVDFMICNC
jgi:hypothetical protein